MAEMNDYSGTFKPDLTFSDFSKDFLLRLMHLWQYAGLQLDAAWFDAVRERLGDEATYACATQAWSRMAERVNPRYAKMANFPLNTVIDSMKVLQLPLDNTTGGLYPVEYDIKSENHVVMTVKQCRSLLFFESQAPERIDLICNGLERQVMAKYVANPNMTVTPLKLPPRKSPDEIACVWEFRLEE
jgi:hypothetical protein